MAYNGSKPGASAGAASGGLVLAWLAGNVADLLTTWTGLALGLREANPLMARMSFSRMVLFKSAAATMMALAFRERPDVLRSLGMGQWGVVGWNAVMVLRSLVGRR